MYFDYCKNKTNSENLMNESTESQAFFKVRTLYVSYIRTYNHVCTCTYKNNLIGDLA